MSWNVYLHTVEEQALYKPTALMSSSAHSSPSGYAGEAGTAPLSPLWHTNHDPAVLQSPAPCHSFFFCSTPGTKAPLPSHQGAELGHCPQALLSTYRRLSLRVAMAACRASSFTASQPGGGPFWSSSFTASTAPSMVPTAALYCSSEGGWQALLATGCRFKETWNMHLIL